MIRGIHGLFYSSKPEETRTFIRDKLQLPFTDHDGWLIFDLQEGEVGVHPTDGDDSMSGKHDISLFTDDVAGTVAELRARGVEFDRDVTDMGWGLGAHFTMPGGIRVLLYQPHYQKKPVKKQKPSPKRVTKAAKTRSRRTRRLSRKRR